MLKKKVLFTAALCITTSAFAVCSSPINRGTDIGYGQVLSSARYNSELNVAYNRSNNLPGDCIVAGSITSSKLAIGAITTSKIADGAITSAKLASGAIPAIGRLLRIRAYTSGAVWTKQSDVGFVYVQAIGGGGASYHVSSTNGNFSAFGTHCVANGGSKPAGASTAGGSGGTATNGDINLPGGSGELSYNPVGSAYSGGNPGYSFAGDYGRGGTGSLSFPSPGGGAGGFCAKVIQESSLNNSEAVNVGTGGNNPGADTTPGKNGIVFVYEYSK